MLAERGFAGPPEPIAGVQGFLAAMGQPVDWPALTDGLGETWEVKENSLKPYPAGFVIHPPLDCALDWRRAHPDAPVERVMVHGNPLLSEPHRPAEHRRREREPGQPAARGGGGARLRQGRAGAVH